MQLNRSFIRILMCVTVFAAAAIAGNAQSYHAPSIYLWYSDGGSAVSPIDIMTIRAKPTITTPSTYFEVFGWNFGGDGGGYTGIQDSGAEGKNFIFSLWDPVKQNGRTASAVYSAPGGQISRFGGEGTGLHYINFSTGWSLNHWYRFIVRRWDQSGDTFFGLWTLDESARKWTHQITMDYPEANIYFSASPCSFLEDWEGTGANVRRFETTGGWVRHGENGWAAISTATFALNRDTATDGTYYNSLDGGLDKGAAYLQCGGATVQTNAAKTRLILPPVSPSPDVPIASCKITNVKLDRAAGTIDVQWSARQSGAPQFSYNIEVFDGSGTLGVPIAGISEIAPEANSARVILPENDDNRFTLQMTLTDVLGRQQTSQTVVVH